LYLNLYYCYNKFLSKILYFPVIVHCILLSGHICCPFHLLSISFAVHFICCPFHLLSISFAVHCQCQCPVLFLGFICYSVHLLSGSILGCSFGPMSYLKVKKDELVLCILNNTISIYVKKI
jgi:hypothetical protein